MTIDALRAIQDKELPEVGRRSVPRTARPQPAALAAPPPPPADDPKSETDQLPIGQLLAWANQHPDPAVQEQGAQARAALSGLRRRHAADTELAAVITEAEQLEQQLAELRARAAELAPSKPKSKRKQASVYPAAAVRAWAAENGHEVSPVGRIPKSIVDAWRQAGHPLPDEEPSR